MSRGRRVKYYLNNDYVGMVGLNEANGIIESARLKHASIIHEFDCDVETVKVFERP